MTPGRPARLVMVAGPNGSGKSTLIAALRAAPGLSLPALYVNADDLQRERGLADAVEAQRLATDLRGRAVAAGDDLLFETVMSHPSKLAELQRARHAGYHVTVHLVATDDPAIHVQRVAARVGAGGHDVPPDRIRARYTRTLALAPLAVALADQAVLFDNTSGGDTGRGLTAHAALVDGGLQPLVPDPAAWVVTVAAVLARRATDHAVLARHPAARGRPLRGPTLAHDRLHGPLAAVTDTLLLQRDEATGAAVLHERVLLGPVADTLAAGAVVGITYRDGEASLDDGGGPGDAGPSPGPPRPSPRRRPVP